MATKCPNETYLATDAEGIFRLSGSAKRIKDLQVIFNSPDRYGKGLDWTGYTVHDAASIFRRYLNQLPEPIVPYEFYERFRDPLRYHQAQAVGPSEGQLGDKGHFDLDAVVVKYQKLITELPPLNRQLLLYLLDLLAVFASKSDLNRMTSSSLATIFQPGILSHPSHEMVPQEYRLSQDVLTFLIEHQDHFLIGMSGTAVDEKTVKDVEGGPPVRSPSQTPKVALGRSASNASGGADSLRKHGVRRNVSVSSRSSRDTASNGIPTPLTPSAGGALASGSPVVGVKRSNTVPSKRSPAATPTSRFQRNHDTPTQLASETHGSSTAESTPGSDDHVHQTPTSKNISSPKQPGAEGINEDSSDRPKEIIGKGDENQGQSTFLRQGTEPPPSKDRKFSNLFGRSPTRSPIEPSNKDARPPNKLKKKQRIPGSTNESAQSSQASLTDEVRQFHTPLVSPELTSSSKPDPLSTSHPTFTNTSATPIAESPSRGRQSLTNTPENQKAGDTLKPTRSPEPSIHSRSSLTDTSDLEAVGDLAARTEKRDKRHRAWHHRFSSSAKKPTNDDSSPLAPPRPIGQNTGAGLSGSSFGSFGQPRKSMTMDSQATQQLSGESGSIGYPAVTGQSSPEYSDLVKDQQQHSGTEQDKKGSFFGKLRARIDKSREDRKEKEAEKERAKSPPRQGQGNEGEQGRHSLTAFAHEHFVQHRPKSVDKSREEVTSPDSPPAPVPLSAHEATTAPREPEKDKSPNHIGEPSAFGTAHANVDAPDAARTGDNATS